jgi:hypothetical protein
MERFTVKEIDSSRNCELFQLGTGRIGLMASTVILTTTGTGRLSSDGKVLTVSDINSAPPFFGADQLRSDYIQLSRSSSTGTFGTGEETGALGGSANPVLQPNSESTKFFTWFAFVSAVHIWIPGGNWLAII